MKIGKSRYEKNVIKRFHLKNSIRCPRTSIATTCGAILQQEPTWNFFGPREVKIENYKKQLLSNVTKYKKKLLSNVTILQQEPTWQFFCPR